MARYAAAIVLTLLMGLSVAGPAEAAITVYPRINSIIGAHPDGGPALAEGIRDAVTRNPKLAQSVIASMRKVTNQRVIGAVTAGLAGAQLDLSRQNPAAADRIARWMETASPTFRTAYGLERGIQSARGGFMFGYSR